MNNSLPTYVGLRRPAIFAHRGSKAYAPENTLAAFNLAVQQQADAIELDTMLSADGQVMVIHDDTVERTTDGSGSVRSLTLTQLKKLDAGSKFNPAYSAEKIPTLAEVFATVGKQIFINVELKNYASPLDDLPDKVVLLVKEYGLESCVMFSSFNILALIRAHYQLPKVPLGLITAVGFAEPTIHSKLVRLGPNLALHPFLFDATPILIQYVHRSNCRVHVHTVNLPNQMQQLFTAGVDGIFTDDPPLAQKIRAEL